MLNDNHNAQKILDEMQHLPDNDPALDQLADQFVETITPPVESVKGSNERPVRPTSRRESRKAS